MKPFSVVVAADTHNGIGKNGALPWSLKGDMRWFKELTTCPDRLSVHARYRLDRAIRDNHVLPPDQWAAQVALPTPDPLARNAVLMGRRTWEGLPEKFKPLPGRLNGVLSRTPGMKSDGTFHLWGSLDAALEDLSGNETVREIFVIGGGQIYAAALGHPCCERLYRTEVDAVFECDTFFPELPPGFVEIAASPILEEAPARYRVVLYERLSANH